MSFIWPLMLLLLALAPLGVVLYVRLQARRKRLMASYGSLGVVQAASKAGKTSHALGLRRHIPPALFLAGLTVLALALARPQAVVGLPRMEGTVILTFDVSGSMAADDLKPTRMEAAKVAARTFVEQQPTTVRIGVVAFSDSGLAVQVPTNDHAVILAAINRLSPARGTSLANGIYAALDVLAKDGEETNYYSNATPEVEATPEPVPPGSRASTAIVLLTDGENTVSPDPAEAAIEAANRGVRVHTIGVGSPEGALLKVEGFTVQTRLDEATLQGISEFTKGAYFNAQTEQDLQAIYGNLGTELVIHPEPTEVTPLFAGAGMTLLLIGGVLSLVWFSRLP
jgi:Ca-activated chloride channel family protein